MPLSKYSVHVLFNISLDHVKLQILWGRNFVSLHLVIGFVCLLVHLWFHLLKFGSLVCVYLYLWLVFTVTSWESYVTCIHVCKLYTQSFSSVKLHCIVKSIFNLMTSLESKEWTLITFLDQIWWEPRQGNNKEVERYM